MNLKLIALTLAAGLALPAATAQAHVKGAHTKEVHTSRAELRHDRAVVHQNQHQLARAVHNGNVQRAKVERRQLSRAKAELRQDKRVFAKQQHRRWHHNHPG